MLREQTKEAMLEFADAGAVGERIQVEQEKAQAARRGAIAGKRAFEIGAALLERRARVIVERNGSGHFTPLIENPPGVRGDCHAVSFGCR